jgi:trehalose synthase-fused probable maltokinase
MPSGLSDLSIPTGWADLGGLLHRWVIAQRWFGGKGRDEAASEIADTALLPGEDGGTDVLVVLLSVTYDNGTWEHYHLPLVADPDSPIGRVGRVSVGDATADQGGVRTLAAAATRDRAVGTTMGSQLVGAPHGAAAEPLCVLDGEARWLGAEQSNSAAVLGEQWFVKVFRRVQAGPNPDVELTAVLTEAGSTEVPHQAGALAWGGVATVAPALVMVSHFETDAEDAWSQAVADAGAVSAGLAPPHGLVDGGADLGRLIAELHRVLADRLGTHEIGHETLAGWAHAMTSQLDRVLRLADGSTQPHVRAVVDAADELHSRFQGLCELGSPGRSMRVHGDLHLGQLLRRADGAWLVLDFEGAPARPLGERRRPHSPLRDVAGMVRSFDYAATHDAASRGEADPPPVLRAWRDELVGGFTAAYDAAAPPHLLPPDPTAHRWLRSALVLDEAVYELGYELDNRPCWAAIPAGGILRVLAGEGAEMTS